jgi:glycosyltransferase involved in cell wall biosynthesis
MNVLQLISSSIGYYGAERVVVTLSAALEELGVSTVVGAFLNTAKTAHLEVLDQAELRGLKTERIPCHGRLDWQAVLAIRSIIERHKIDVIHCHGIKPDLYAFLAARQYNIPLVSTCHLWTFDSKKAWLVSALERCILHAIDRVVVVSDHIIPQLRRFGVRAQVIYNGIDLEPFYKPASDFKMKMNWSGRPVVGAIARLAPQKGLQYLLRAVPEVLRESPKALFVIVGDGPERQALEAEAKCLGIQDSVSFLGVREDIPELLSSMDVLAMPSLDEGLPMALLEAMASGKAVVATGVGGIPRVIQNRVNGIIVSPGDVYGLAANLRNLLKHGEFRLVLGQKARATVESQFSAATMAKRYLEVYSGVPSKVGFPLPRPRYEV